MASTSGGGHGGRRNNSGRKRLYTSTRAKNEWSKCHKRIYLEENIFKSWVEAKFIAGYEGCNDSVFAAHMLSLEYRRRTLEENSSSHDMIKRRRVMETDEGPMTSTPVKPLPSHSLYTESPVVCLPDMDFSMLGEDSQVSTRRENLNSSLFSDDEGSVEDLEDMISLEGVTSYKELYNSAIQELNAEDESTSDNSDTKYDTDDDQYSDDQSVLEDSGGETDEETEQSTVTLSVPEGPEYGPATPSVPEYGPATPSVPEYGPHLKLSRGQDMYKFEEELKLVKERKFICSLDLFLDLFVKCCRIPGCNNVPCQVKHHFVGTTLVVHTTCQAGHKYSFASSHEKNGMYVNNVQSAAALLLSGNNFLKISRMAQFLNLGFVSESTFYRIQRLYLFPAVEEWWAWMREQLVKEFVGKKIVVGGDGQCDSPGFSAKNLCYFLMEITSSYILEVEVRDKRHVGLLSTNMEVQALKNALSRLETVLDIVEVATDASASIKKFIANEYQDVFHSLDVWHKSKSIRKCLGKIGKGKPLQKIKAWSDHIVKHFWYCGSVCKQTETTSDEEALKIMKDKWIGLLHHVCDSHEWDYGKCDHDEQIHDPNLPWFDRRDKDFAELQKIILNPELLASFKYYVRFRHTGSLECANSLTLVYTPKRTPFTYRAFKARKYLAAIDWNYHLSLNPATNKSGDQITSRKYNQRTKQWDLRFVKVKKGYEYIPLLIAKVLNARMQDTNAITRSVSMNKSDPRLLAPTIAVKPPPSSKDLLKRKSRFSLVPTTTTSAEKRGESSSPEKNRGYIPSPEEKFAHGALKPDTHPSPYPTSTSED